MFQFGNGYPLSRLIHLLGDGYGCILLPMGILSVLKHYPVVIAVTDPVHYYPYPTYPVPDMTCGARIPERVRYIYKPQKTLNL